MDHERSAAMNASMPGHVVIGVDDKPGSELALEWAAAEAAARHTPLRVVAAFQWVLPYRWNGSYVDVHDPEQHYLRQMAEQLAATMADRARALGPGVTVSGAAIEGSPVEVLLKESKHAALLAVGSRQLKTFASAILGSVSAAVAARAHGPAVVIRGPAGNPAEGAAVVVGVDGRDAAEAQLAYGFEHASRHEVPLRAVLCWRPDVLASMEWRPEPPPPERAERWLGEVIAGWQDKYPDVPVHTAVVREHPVAGLVNEAAGAHLLVVRAHGRHALTGTLLGSVSQGVLHHATCPVAVIPEHG
jgi:nucleotide-binding universal stress UspA family protein